MMNKFDVGLPEGLVPADAKVQTAAGVCFLEGPAWHPSGDVYFSDIAGNRILKRSADGLVSVFRADSGRTNGNTFDGEGRLISCEGSEFGPGGRRRLVRTTIETGEVEVLTERFEGKRYNAPNDVCVDTRGRIWFTDPYYWTDPGSLELDHQSVYCLEGGPESKGGKLRRVATQPDIGRPNGIAISPDAKTLYLVDNHNGPGGNRKIWAFDVSDDGVLSGQRLVFDFGRGRGGDGMRLDRAGNLWIAAGVHKIRSQHETDEVQTGVYVVSPEGKLLGRIPIFEDVITNLCFGGPEMKTLFVTAGKFLFRIETNTVGYALWPPLGK